MESKQGEFLKQFNRLNKELGDLYHEMSVRLGLSDSVCDILYDIFEVGDGCLQRDICRMSFISKQTVSSAIRKLEREGLIRLIPGRGREMQIFLTEPGRKLMEEKIVPIVNMENAAFLEMTPEESRELLRLTEKYISCLRKRVKCFRLQEHAAEAPR